MTALHEFSNWLSATPASHLIQETHGAIADIQIVHILSLATLFALALNLSLRILGRGLAAESLASLSARFVPGIWACLAVLLLTGTLLIIAEPGRTITNSVFYIKMSLLLVAVALTFWLAALARRPAARAHPLHVAAVVLYMMVWVSIIFAGRYIAYRI